MSSSSGRGCRNRTAISRAVSRPIEVAAPLLFWGGRRQVERFGQLFLRSGSEFQSHTSSAESDLVRNLGQSRLRRSPFGSEAAIFGSFAQPSEIGTPLCLSEKIHTGHLVAKGAAMKLPFQPPDDLESCRIQLHRQSTARGEPKRILGSFQGRSPCVPRRIAADSIVGRKSNSAFVIHPDLGIGSRGRARTFNPSVNSRLLYH